MPLTFRPGTPDDSYTTFRIFQDTALDLGQRLGATAITGSDDAKVLEELWQRRRPLFEHLARTCEHFWIAEEDGEAIGYARSVLRDGLRQLTEYFVLPGRQSKGIGRELLAHVLPIEGAVHRSILATIDQRALVRYLKSGVYPRFPAYHFFYQPEAGLLELETDLTFERLTSEHLVILSTIDQAIIGHTRDVDHEWLMNDWEGYLYRREGKPVGYGYIGYHSGPFALLDERNYLPVLSHAEHVAVERGDKFGVEAPLANRHAVDYLLMRGYQMDSFFEFFMTNDPFGKFENYIFTSPPFFL